MSQQADLLGAFECHDAQLIRDLLAAGVSPVDLIDGKRPVDCLIEMYSRSSRFVDCLRVMLEHGATVGDPLLEAVLLDDDEALRALLAESTENLNRKLSPLCAYTSCRGVSPLHICAEFNSVRCLRLLIASGADVNARADIDEQGIGGHTPIFHTVNSNSNYCRPAMEILTEAGADLDVQVKMVLWGDTMTWETVVYDVTPVSYAQCGLYSQFHRREEQVYGNIAYLLSKRNGAAPAIRNVPNKYLKYGH
jgi:ankyrin repeat protein